MRKLKCTFGHDRVSDAPTNEAACFCGFFGNVEAAEQLAAHCANTKEGVVISEEMLVASDH